MNSPKRLGVWNVPESLKAKIQPQIEREKQIIEIVTITDKSTDEVIEFLDNSRYDHDTIWQGLLAGASLDDNSILEFIIGSRYGDMKSLTDLSFKKSFTDYLSDVSFYTGYWLVYPFIWLAYWFWMGIVEAKEEIWDYSIR